MNNSSILHCRLIKHAIVSGATYLLAALTALHLSCAQKLPDNLHSQFKQWYLNPSQDKTDMLCAYPLTQKIIDSLARRYRATSVQRGAHAVTLNDSAGTPYTVGILPPASFDAASAYPLIIYLHGGVGTHLNTKGEKAYDMLAFLRDSVAVFLASPSANRACPWWSPGGLFRILQTARYMNLYYPVDADRIILAGVSDGATGCYAAANTVDTIFAGFIAVSGFGGMLQQLGMPLSPVNLKQRPVYNVNAGRDHLYPVEYVNRFLDWMIGQGIHVERKIYPDEKHGFDYRDKERAALTRIIRSWRRPKRAALSWTVIEKYPNAADNILSYQLEDGENPAFIKGHFRGDTLNIQHNRMKRALLACRAADAGGVSFAIANRQPANIKSLKPSPDLLCAAIQHRCRLSAGSLSYYDVTF